MTLSKRMTSFCITLVVASLFLSIYASAASAPIHKTTVWVAPETETLINGIPESQTPMVTDVIMGPYFYRYDYNQKTTVDKYRHIAHFSHDNRLNKLSEQMEAQITNSASQGAEWSGNVEFTAEIKKKIIESLKGTLGISYKETRTTNEAVGYKVVHTVPAGKVGHINLYYPLQPKNRKAIYLNSTNGILACMTFLYSEEELGKRMLTIDSLPAEAVATFQKEDDINIQETYEMVLEDQHCIVLLKFVSTESLQSNQEQAVTRYRA